MNKFSKLKSTIESMYLSEFLTCAVVISVVSISSILLFPWYVSLGLGLLFIFWYSLWNWAHPS